MLILRKTNEERKESEAFISKLSEKWNIAFLEVRGVGENGWDTALQWHVRRASAWSGRTIASMQVYDVLRCLEYCRTLEGVDPDKIGIAAKDEMGVVALYTALMDGNCEKLILDNPPGSQDIPSQPYGGGAATEMLNCLRVTDIYQIPALIYPTEIAFSRDIPKTYQWAEKIISKLGGKFLTY